MGDPTVTIIAKFPSTCPTCRRPISEGDRVNWERGQKVTHVACPKGAALAVQILAQPTEAQRANISALCEALDGERLNPGILGEGAAVLTEALEVIEEQLTAEYERQAPAVPPASPKVAARLAGLARLTKGIYRVSLTGQETRYGLTHVNVNLVPSEKFGSVKLSEWQGVDVGYITPEGRLEYWRARPATQWSEARPAVNPADSRVAAVVAALDVILGAADPIEFARAYAVEAASCWRCGADLVDEKSRERLLGPDCFRAVAKGA